jgi:Arc/MetJ-type ribon-helix-helix transcriptional regulator
MSKQHKQKIEKMVKDRKFVSKSAAIRYAIDKLPKK